MLDQNSEDVLTRHLLKLSEIEKRLGRENFVISFNERENFDFGSRELEEYEKLFIICKY